MIVKGPWVPVGGKTLARRAILIETWESSSWPLPEGYIRELPARNDGASLADILKETLHNLEGRRC